MDEFLDFLRSVQLDPNLWICGKYPDVNTENFEILQNEMLVNWTWLEN